MTDATISSAQRRLLLAATVCVAVGTALLFRTGTAVNARLFMNEGFAHVDAVQWEQTLAVLAMACVPALFVPRFLVRVVATTTVFALAAVLGWASADQGGYPYSAWALPAHAIRVGAPFALLLALYAARTRAPERSALAAWLMLHVVTFSTATVFVVHGLEALDGHPWFVDLAITSAGRVLDARWSQSGIERVLMGVGVLDITVAMAVLIARSRVAIYWMGFWGVFTAALRVIAYGSGAFGEMIVRLPHGILPLVLLPAISHPELRVWRSWRRPRSAAASLK